MKKISMLAIAALLILIILSCGKFGETPPTDIIAKDFKFQIVDSIPSGWTTFNFKNEGHTDHFFLLDYLMDSITYDMYLNEVVLPFQPIMDSLVAGMSKQDAVGLMLRILPPWYFTKVKQMGGAGITAMGDSCLVTLDLPPGNYAIECYVKERGKFHTTLGMIKSLKVTNQVSGVEPPEANVNISLTKDAITTTGTMHAGTNVCEVHYIEKPDVGIGSDVHIVGLDDNTNIDSVVHWLDWMNIDGLQNPPPAEFYGGVQEMPVGNISYFTVNLKPGRYAFIMECSPERKVLKEFTVE